MALTAAQKTSLKAAIVADSTANAFYTIGDLGGLADYYNAVASPDFTVWKSKVTITEIGDAIVATELAGLTALNLQRLQALANYGADGINPSLSDRRAAFDDIFSGAGGAGTRPRLLALWKRLATRVEKVFAVGTGSDPSPATLGFEGRISYMDVMGI